MGTVVISKYWEGKNNMIAPSFLSGVDCPGCPGEIDAYYYNNDYIAALFCRDDYDEDNRDGDDNVNVCGSV